MLIALNIGTSRSNGGEVQQEALIAWQDAIETSTSLTRFAPPFYHISVIEGGAPFFVRGAIRRGLAESFENLIDLERGGVLFLSKAEKFAKQAEIPPIDGGEPTLVVVSSDGTITGYVKGGRVDALALSQLDAIWEKAK